MLNTVLLNCLQLFGEDALCHFLVLSGKCTVTVTGEQLLCRKGEMSRTVINAPILPTNAQF